MSGINEASGVSTLKSRLQNFSSSSKTQEPQNNSAMVKKDSMSGNSTMQKTLPYVSAGVSVGAAAVATAAVIKGKKTNKQLINKINTLEKVLEDRAGTIKVNSDSNKKMTSFLVGLLGAATGGAVVSHFDKNKEDLKSLGLNDDEIESHKTKVENAFLQKENQIGNIERTSNDAIRRSQEAETKVNTIEVKTNDLEGRVNSAQDAANTAINRANAVSDKSRLGLAIHKQPWHGLNLMVVNNNEKYLNKSKIDSAMDDIHTAVIYRVGRENGQTKKLISDYRKKYVPLLKSNSTWAITAEFDPIKAGGLGSVPMEIQNNFTDMGIDNPVFIPMYQHKGKAEFIEYGNEKTGKSYKYIYGGDKFDLTKMAEMTVPQYRGDKVTNQNVEFFIGHPVRQAIDGSKSPNKDQQLIFVKNTDNFGGDIYANNYNADETEKFAFLSKAIYQLAEAKVSNALGKNKTSLGEIKITDEEAYNSVKPPVAMVLNDWHAASMAGLLRYKAPMENAYNIIEDDVKDALRDMPLLMIGHNAGIPGATRNHSVERSDMVVENIVNTLYDGFAYGIVENASTGSQYSAVDNSIVYEKDNDQERQFNNLAHGIALSDYYIPVSKNYEKELKSGKQASGMAFNIIERRSGNDTISGIINGLDRELNTTEAKAGWLKNKFGIKLKTYNHLTPIDEVMEARQHNKMEFYDNFLKPLMNGEGPKGGYKYQSVGPVANISREDFEQAPMIAFAHRLTDQKGAGIFANAVIETFNNWDEKHPGKPKPFIAIGGELEEAHEGQFLKMIKNPKNYKNKDDVNRIQALQGFMPNPSLYSAVTYFCAPSTFEPCGLTQGECYAMGTPIFTTATGGFVDTVKDGYNGFVAKYDSTYANDIKQKNLKGSQEEQDWFQSHGHDLAEKFNEGLDVFFNDKDKYKSIVKNNLNENLSWNQGKSDDAIHQYIDRLVINKDDIIEANVAPLRSYIVKSLKEFDKLQKGEINKDAFEKTTKILDFANEQSAVSKDKNKVYSSFDKENGLKKSKIGSNMNLLDKVAQTCKNNQKINPNDSKSKAKLELIEIKQSIENDKLAVANESESVANRDKEMFDRFISEYLKSKSDMKSSEFSEFNEWKDGLISRYCA